MKRLVVLLILLVVAPVMSAPSPRPASPKPKPTAYKKPGAPATPKIKYPEVKTESGLIIQDIVIGKGAPAQPGQIITVNYVGRLLGGREFDNSYKRGAPFAFVLGDRMVIAGWDEGVANMRVGGRRRLVVPPELGYKDNIVGSIPPDSTLEFDIELLDVKPQPASSPAK